MNVHHGNCTPRGMVKTIEIDMDAVSTTSHSQGLPYNAVRYRQMEYTTPCSSSCNDHILVWLLYSSCKFVRLRRLYSSLLGLLLLVSLGSGSRCCLLGLSSLALLALLLLLRRLRSSLSLSWGVLSLSAL